MAVIRDVRFLKMVSAHTGSGSMPLSAHVFQDPADRSGIDASHPALDDVRSTGMSTDACDSQQDLWLQAIGTAFALC